MKPPRWWPGIRTRVTWVLALLGLGCCLTVAIRDHRQLAYLLSGWCGATCAAWISRQDGKRSIGKPAPMAAPMTTLVTDAEGTTWEVLTQHDGTHWYVGQPKGYAGPVILDADSWQAFTKWGQRSVG